MTLSLGALLASQVRQRGDQPYLTYYDDATGERTELGYAAFENWTVKTAGLLADHGVEPGERVLLATSGHWVGLVAVFACGLVGAVARVVEGQPMDIAGQPSDPDEFSFALLDERHAAGAAVPALLVGRGLGGRITQPRAEVESYAEEVLGYEDTYDDPQVTGDNAWLELALGESGTLRQVRLTQVEALEAVEGLATQATRALGTGALDRGETVLAAVALLAAGGSLVTVRDGDRTTHERVAADERCTATLAEIAAEAAEER